jgi:hypothetical protein
MAVQQLEQLDELATLIASLDRTALINQLSSFPAGFELDFSPEFLAIEPLDRLRHIFMALCLHTRRAPDLAGIAAI